MNLIIRVLILSTLLSSQVFGATLCTSICFTDLSKNAVKTAEADLPPCHQAASSEKPVSEMPENCDVMNVLKLLSSYNVNVLSFNVDFASSADSLFANFAEIDFSQTLVLAYKTSIPLNIDAFKNSRPVYLYTQKFII